MKIYGSLYLGTVCIHEMKLRLDEIKFKGFGHLNIFLVIKNFLNRKNFQNSKKLQN